ncbi:hypothetical protein ACG04R_23985 [Roseateles sp. BYS78W]|uniref:Fido domain-containing protein n=1 Tax=Pelomonas candidula TaxID=3299025 RepID=A0ABW7HIN1_9BURK
MMTQLEPITESTVIDVAQDLEAWAASLLQRLRTTPDAFSIFNHLLIEKLQGGTPISALIECHVPEHPLTELVRAQRPSFSPHLRSDITLELEASRLAFSAPRLELRQQLCFIAASIGVTSEIRAAGVMAIGSPDTGNVIFPAQAHIGPQMAVLEKWRSEWRERNPLLGIIISMILLQRIHLFKDSNGRTTRSFFSLEFSELIGRFSYIPWTLAASINPICWHLRLREAQGRGKWNGIVLHALTVIESMLTAATTAEAK